MSPGNRPATTVTDEETIVRTSRIAHTAVDAPAVDEELSTRRLNIMRFGYAFMGSDWPLSSGPFSCTPIPARDGRGSHLPADRHVTPGVPRA